MKPCKYCSGIGTQGIGQDYCDCQECNGTGLRNYDLLLIGSVSVAVIVACIVTVLVEVIK